MDNNASEPSLQQLYLPTEHANDATYAETSEASKTSAPIINMLHQSLH